MFDTTNATNKTVMNTPATGTLQKSNAKSFFLRMHSTSSLAGTIFSREPKYENVKVIVLQVLLMDKEWLLVEVIAERDFIEVSPPCGAST